MIGSALSERLRAEGYKIYILKRHSLNAPFRYLHDSNRVVLDPNIPLCAVINLAGPSLADKRWSPARKKLLVQSRVNITSALSEALAR